MAFFTTPVNPSYSLPKVRLSRRLAYGILESAFWLILRSAEAIDAVTSRWRKRAVTPGEIALVTGHTHHIAGYARPIAEQNAAYAARHGYAFYLHTDEDFHPTRPASWSKILFVQSALRHHRWVVWCDADALVMNQSIKLESRLDSRYDFIIAQWHGPVPEPHVNCGVFLVQRSVFSRAWLACIWRMRHCVYHYWWEQAAINRLLALGRWRRVWRNPRYRDFNAFIAVEGDPDPYQPGDFIAHLSGYRSTPERTAAIQTLIRTIVT